jgi:hypothetical protein
MEVDGMENGVAIGKCLRIKVRKCLAEPLMRGTMVEVDDKGRTIWCLMEYEHLPDFCFTCGVLGHVNMTCSKKLKRGEEPQYGKWLKWIPPKKMNTFSNQRVWTENRGRRNYLLGNNENRWASDGPSWRKDVDGGQKSDKTIDGGQKEGASQLKLTLKGDKAEGERVLKENENKGTYGVLLSKEKDTEKGEGKGEEVPAASLGVHNVKNGTEGEAVEMEVVGKEDIFEEASLKEGRGDVKDAAVNSEAGKQKKRGSFKRVQRLNVGKKDGSRRADKKRGPHEMDVDEENCPKKIKVQPKEGSGEGANTNLKKAGLPEQLRESQ